ncbi:hypothetical protein pb186bvf_001459 [Paramecium bursaria]
MDSYEEQRKLLMKYNIRLLKFTILVSIGLFLIILERIFKEPIGIQEVKTMIYIQEKLGISDQKWFKTIFYVLANLQEQEIFILILTHLFVLIYFKYDKIIAIKTFMLVYLSWYLLILLELTYETPQPFWKSAKIVTFMCDQKFASPSDTTFLVSVLVFSLIGQFNRWESFTKKLLYNIIATCCILIYSYFFYISGQVFITDLCLGGIYFMLVQAFAQNFDQDITLLIKRKDLMFGLYGIMIVALMGLSCTHLFHINLVIRKFGMDQKFLLVLLELDNIRTISLPTFTQITVIVPLAVIAAIDIPDLQPSNWQMLLMQLSIIPWWGIIFSQGFLTEVDLLRRMGLTQMICDGFIFMGLHWWSFSFIPKKFLNIRVQDNYQQLI